MSPRSSWVAGGSYYLPPPLIVSGDRSRARIPRLLIARACVRARVCAGVRRVPSVGRLLRVLFVLSECGVIRNGCTPRVHHAYGSVRGRVPRRWADKPAVVYRPPRRCTAHRGGVPPTAAVYRPPRRCTANRGSIPPTAADIK